MSLGLVGDLVSNVGYASYSLIKSSTFYLGIEVVSRVAESCYQKSMGVLPRPDRGGFARVAFKLIRPFSGLDPNGSYKYQTKLLVLSTVGISAITLVARQLIANTSVSCP